MLQKGSAVGFRRLLAVLGIGFCFFSQYVQANSFTLFESGQVRPITLSPDGRYLFALNTPDNRLEIFRINARTLIPVNSVQVGLEPVSLAFRPQAHEAWVVNHLSDSVSVVDVSNPTQARVIRTLWVGDEPRDIVFAGRGFERAFVTAAHRGQNTGHDPQLTTPGIGRADVWVFDADNPGTSAGGDPLKVITLFTDTPRALAATPDGSIVYAAGFLTGNRTTTINEFLVRQGTAPPFNRIYPPPITNHEDIPQPTVGLIVQFDGTHWVDELGQQWDDMVPFELPDTDVFTIDAAADPPGLISGAEFTGVGTVLFNMIVNPVNGTVYVANTDANNRTRFEGAGIFSGGRTVRGHLHESRITMIEAPGQVKPRHLNKHIDYSQCCAPIPNNENATSVAFPQAMAITNDGSTLYVPMFGTSEVAVYDTEELADDTFIPDPANQIAVSGGGPSGVALDEARKRLYVLTRFDNSIAVVDTEKRREIAHIPLFNPEPPEIVAGRPLLYDASLTSSHGDSACASCHVFGDLDGLAWDLGDPDNIQTLNIGPFRVSEAIGFFLLRGRPENPHFRPMKGPMTTQSLRGLANHGSMHWRGDRTGGNDDILESSGPNGQPNGGAFDEDKAFRKFNVAFIGLNGRNSMIPEEDMQQFSDFALEITYPPNPIRNLDNSLTVVQQAGQDIFFGEISDSFFNCNGCHVLDPDGNREFPEVKRPGFFGTDGSFSFEGESQFFKVPHLRNLYQKVGMFGMAPPPQPNSPVAPLGSLIFAPLANNGFLGPQIRGFGFMHDGSVDTVFRFLSGAVFAERAPGTIPSLDPRTPPELVPDPGNPEGFAFTPEGIARRRQVEAFLLAFDSNLAPIVGQQVTLRHDNLSVVSARIDLMIQRAEAGECDMVARNRFGGYLYTGNDQFKFSRAGIPLLPDQVLRHIATSLPDAETTYTCVPPGSGYRIGLDRDEDGILDGNDPITRMNAQPNGARSSG
ncbi:MAG: YncE family protein [Gammaproteobacteria bacterium]